jgi:hypothetical protein
MPSSLRAGDTWQLLLTLADHDAPTWSSVLYFEKAGLSFSVNGAASGSQHSFTLAAADSAGKEPGNYKWFIRATAAGIVDTVLEGWLDILPDLAAAKGRDHRGPARVMLDAVNATLLGRASSDQLAMTINGRSISRIPLPELRQWQAQLKQEVRTEEKGAAAGLGRNIKVRYARP